MRVHSGGAIAITSSTAGLRGAQGMGPYVASKHAVTMQRYGRGEEIAALTAFLCSDEASFCSGATYLRMAPPWLDDRRALGLHLCAQWSA